MKDLSGVDSAKPIELGEEVCDMISEYTEKVWYTFTAPEEGVYKFEYTKDTIDAALVYEKPRFFFQHSRLVDKRHDIEDKKYIELFYFEKGKTYHINLILKPYLKYGTFTFKISAHEVPANNYRETAYEWDLSQTLVGKLDYVTDTDWFIFYSDEEIDYKIIYSREIAEAILFFEEDSNKALIPLDEKIYLVNDTVAEPYHFKANTKYYMKIEHIQRRSLGKYTVRFIKIDPKMSALKRYYN